MSQSNDESAQNASTTCSSSFLSCHPEKLLLNQYWYSNPTIAAMVAEAHAVLDAGGRVACLSTPSIYFSIHPNKRKNAMVMDYDEMWSSDPGFVKYDYKDLSTLPDIFSGTFDLVVIDPPFITAEVWQSYAQAAKKLLKKGTTMREYPLSVAQHYISSLQHAHDAPAENPDSSVSFAGTIAAFCTDLFSSTPAVPTLQIITANNEQTDNTTSTDTSSASSSSSSSSSDTATSSSSPSSDAAAPAPASEPAEPRALIPVPNGRVLASTIPEHEGFLYRALGTYIAKFRPSIPNLIYQYSFYINYPMPLKQRLNAWNPEIDDDEIEKEIKYSSRKKSNLKF